MTARTDPASPRRLRRARDAGDFPRSKSLKRGLTWAATLWIVPSAVSTLWHYGKTGLLQAISVSQADPPDLVRASGTALENLTRLTTPLLVVVLAASLAAHFAESRGLALARNGRERFRISFVRPFTLAQWVPWLSLAALVGYGWHWWRSLAVSLAAVVGRSMLGRDLAARSALHLAWIACATWLVLGGLELVLSHRAWIQRLSMTRDEKRREQRELEGDALLGSVRKERHQESLSAPTLTLLSETSIVVHEGYETAVLVRYVEDRDRAPRVLAIETGQMASTVIKEAESSGVPTHEDMELTRVLARCRQGSEVPENTYQDLALLLGRATRPLSLDAELAARGW